MASRKYEMKSCNFLPPRWSLTVSCWGRLEGEGQTQSDFSHMWEHSRGINKHNRGIKWQMPKGNRNEELVFNRKHTTGVCIHSEGKEWNFHVLCMKYSSNSLWTTVPKIFLIKKKRKKLFFRHCLWKVDCYCSKILQTGHLCLLVFYERNMQRLLRKLS